MHPSKRLSIKSATVAGIAASALLGLAGLTLNPAPAKAVVYSVH
jgi:4-hydroxybenzoate polyprenyltransferase